MQQSTHLVFFGARTAHDLVHQWWVLALRGLCGIVFGILAILAPGLTLAWLLLVFAAYLLVDGILAVGSAVMAARQGHRWAPLALEAVLSILLALVIFVYPGLSLLFAVTVIGVWALFTGVSLLFASLHFGFGAWPMMLSAVVSILMGILLLLAPVAGAVVLATWLGIYAFVFGFWLIVLAFRLRALGRRSAL